MLSQEKIEKLQPFIEHKTFGLLLKDAIEKWKKEFNPVRCESGLAISNGKYINKKFSKNNCCLIGSALLEKLSTSYSHYGDVAVHYNLTSDQVESIVSGFDCVRSLSDRKDYTEEFLFGYNIAKIIFEEIKEEIKEEKQ